MGDPSIQDMDSGHAVLDGINAVVQLGQHAAADIAACNQLFRLCHMELGNQRGRVLRVPAHALDICQEGQLLRVNRPGNGAGRVVR